MVEINKKSEYKKNNYTIIKISIAIISWEFATVKVFTQTRFHSQY